MVVPGTPRSALPHASHATTGELVSLLRRIAAADRTAFASLHAHLRSRLAAQLATEPLVPADVTAVVDATFVEVWWLAGRHTGREHDGLAWIHAVAARRAGDRRVARMARPPGDGQPLDVLETFDRLIEMELSTLLAHSTSPGHERLSRSPICSSSGRQPACATPPFGSTASPSGATTAR